MHFAASSATVGAEERTAAVPAAASTGRGLAWNGVGPYARRHSRLVPPSRYATNSSNHGEVASRSRPRHRLVTGSAGSRIGTSCRRTSVRSVSVAPADQRAFDAGSPGGGPVEGRVIRSVNRIVISSPSASIVASTHTRGRVRLGLTTAPGGSSSRGADHSELNARAAGPPFVDDLSRLRVSLRHDDERSSDDARREPDAVDPMSEPRHIRRCSTRHGPTPSRGLPSSQSDRDPPTRHVSRPVRADARRPVAFRPAGITSREAGFAGGGRWWAFGRSCARMVTWSRPRRRRHWRRCRRVREPCSRLRVV
jgi:hypothetical protein